MDVSQRLAEVAREQHSGQVDKLGNDIYTHHIVPVSLALQPFGPDAMLVGILHDVVEDTPVTLDQLEMLGAPARVLQAVDAVSRRDGESYTDYIVRCSCSPLGRIVKVIDLNQNLSKMSSLRLVHPERADSLTDRYRRALKLLQDVILRD